MHCKVAAIVLTGLLPLVTLADATNVQSSAQETGSLHLKLICRSGAVVTVDNAKLVEQGLRTGGVDLPSTDGTGRPVIRLSMPDGGTVSIPWDEIEKIAVGDQSPSQKKYPIEVTLKDIKQTRAGVTYGYANYIVGQSAGGDFTIQLNEVKEIITLPPSEEE